MPENLDHAMQSIVDELCSSASKRASTVKSLTLPATAPSIPLAISATKYASSEVMK
jgi:hypothetical protein